MKRILISILLTITVMSYSQENYFLLPKGHINYLYKKVGDDLRMIDSTSLPISTLYTFLENRKIVSINSDTTQLVFNSIDSDSLISDFSIPLPDTFKLRTLRAIDSYLLLGGDWNAGNSFYVFDYIKKTMYKVPIPSEIYFRGKAIDDFVFLHDKIVAVDNVIFPKYLLEYEISDLPSLKNPRIIYLKIPGSYGTIRKGAANSDFIILLSSSRRSAISYISITMKGEYNNGFYLTSNKWRKWHSFLWTDIEIMNNKLYIGCWEKGLGTLMIKPQYFPKNETSWDEGSFRKIPKKRIKYNRSSPKQVVDIVKFDQSKVIVIYFTAKNDYNFKLL